MTMSRALLADYERNAANAERERIIKLLETAIASQDKKNIYARGIKSAIGIIKGENK